ncbi:hypothetical protein Agub_g7823, partial [Astrephomene gubernaculifera]
LRYMETQLLAPGEGEGEGEEQGGAALEVDEESLARLGQFMVAASNWEAYRHFMGLMAVRHPELQLQGVMQAAGMSDDDEWWVKVPDIPDDDDGDGDGDGEEQQQQAGGASSTGGSGAGGQQQQQQHHRHPQVDWARVEAIAALDVDVLALLTDLEASSYSEESFMRWYFHPGLG